eukprot:15484864-Alexandrium_andersonii.AAC.1
MQHQAFEPGTARAQELPQIVKLVPEAPERCVLRRVSSRFRICPRKRASRGPSSRDRKLASANPQSSNLQAAQS